MKRQNNILLSLCIILLLLLLTACQSQKVDSISIYDLQKAMLAADSSLPDMLTVNSSATDAADNFSYLSEMDYEKVDAYFLAYSSTGLADEIAVIRLRDSKDVSEAEKSLQAHAQDRVNLYKTYDPSQLERAQNAMIFSKGNYAVLIISNQSDLVKKAFEENAFAK